MQKFYISKFMQYFLVVLVTITLNFFLPRMMPGDPLQFIVGEDIESMSEEAKDAVREKYGLNKPMGQQYVEYMKQLLHGDLGYSYRASRPVWEVIGERLPWTILLSLFNILLTTVFGVILGALAAWNRGRKQDVILNNTMAFFQSMPSFWLGMIMIAVFGAKLGWFPTYGARTVFENLTGMAYVLDIVEHMALPVITLVLINLSSVYLTMRYSMIDVLGEDYILMAQMKGLTDKKVRYVHAMRNALIPVVTTVMLNLGHIVGGSTIIETVFSYPGMGRLMYESVLNRDYPVIQGCFLITTLCVILANIITDMLYPLIDPKVV